MFSIGLVLACYNTFHLLLESSQPCIDVRTFLDYVKDVTVDNVSNLSMKLTEVSDLLVEITYVFPNYVIYKLSQHRVMKES